VAAGRGDVFEIVSAEFTGNVKVPLAVFSDESVTVTGNETAVMPDGGTPDSAPPDVSVSHDGNPVEDQMYPPAPPDAVNVSE
jgi:hypothetical protein